MTDRIDETELTYAAFGAWYDNHRSEVLDPAFAAATEALDALIGELPQRDRSRIRATSGRVKSKQRTWRKIQQPQNRTRISTTADIPSVISDLVGLRMTCTNLRDIEMVQDVLDALPDRRRKGALWFESGSERDYVVEPKESGYRGLHVSVGVSIDQGGEVRPVLCELQIRTVLQDGWGELTHEDTYSKDGALPPLVETLSKRMADLLATLDDIAEDLRTELDRIDEATVTASANTDEELPDLTAGPGADAASLMFERWKSLDRPTDLAGLAWELQREFGAEISDDWFGYRGFKRFLTHAVPDAEISTGRQAYLLPAAPVEEEPAPEPDDPLPDSGPLPSMEPPDLATKLRTVDPRFPLLDTEQWRNVYAGLAEAWAPFGRRQPNARVINDITRAARDRLVAAGSPVARRHIDYVAKAVIASADPVDPLGADAIGDGFAAQTIQRMTDLRILHPRNKGGRRYVERWLTGSAER